MKLAYNITYVVDPQHVDHWRLWMTREYLPKLMDTGCFLSYRLHKMIGLPNSDEPTYNVQLLVENKSMLNQYQQKYESDHNQFLHRQFKNKLVEFRSTMAVVEEG